MKAPLNIETVALLKHLDATFTVVDINKNTKEITCFTVSIHRFNNTRFYPKQDQKIPTLAFFDYIVDRIETHIEHSVFDKHLMKLVLQ